MTRALTLFVICLSTTNLRADTPTTTSAPDPSQPITRISFPGRPWVGKAVFSKDGESLFVHLPNNAINVWEVFTYHWPEALGALLILTAIICCVAMARVVRSKRIPGAPHCRKCNYCLHEFKGDRCPECNHTTNRPRTGRPQWFRLLPWSGALIALAVFYLCLWVIDVPRTGWANNYFQLWSPGILDWATKKNIAWIVARGIAVDEIVDFDSRSGTQNRILFCQPSHIFPRYSCMQLTKDGDGLILPLHDDDALGIVSTDSGRITRSLKMQDIPSGKRTKWQQIAGYSDDGSTIYVTVLDEKQRSTKLFAWNTLEQSSKLLLQTNAYIQTLLKSPSIIVSHHFLKVPFSDCFVEIPSQHECGGLPPEPVELIVHNPSGPLKTESLKTTMWGFQDPVFSPDGKNVLINSKDFMVQFKSISLTGDHTPQPIYLPPGHFLDRFFSVDADQNLLVLETHYNAPPPFGLFKMIKGKGGTDTTFLTKDTSTRKWNGCFVAPENWIGMQMSLGPRKSYLATQGFIGSGMTGKRTFIQEILIFDLRTLPHKEVLGQLTE